MLSRYEKRIGVVIKGKSHVLPGPDAFQREAESRIVDEDLESCQTLIVPSAGIVDAPIPDIPEEGAVFVDPYIFVSLQEGGEDYHFMMCGHSALGAGSHAGVKRVVFLITDGNVSKMWAIERGFYEASESLEVMGFHVPEHAYAKFPASRLR
jgi:hypothetical protein